MKMKIGKQYIVEVSEEGIVPVEEFDKNRFFDKDHDELDMLTEAEKEDMAEAVAITVLNTLSGKVWDMTTEKNASYDEAISDVLDLVEQVKQDIRSKGSDKCSKEKTGYWIVEPGDRETGYDGCTMCSECSGEGDTEMDYCPHCGIKMGPDPNADKCPCDECKHDGGDIECSGCGDDYSGFEPRKSAKRYVTYDLKGEVISVSDHLQIDKCENYGGYIINADTYEVYYQSAIHYRKHGNYRSNKKKPSDVEKAIAFAETWLDMHEDVTENPYSHLFYQTVLDILKKVEKLANGTNGDAMEALFPHGRREAREPMIRFMVDNYAYEFSYKWWNAPYKLPNSNKDNEVGA